MPGLKHTRTQWPENLRWVQFAFFCKRNPCRQPFPKFCSQNSLQFMHIDLVMKLPELKTFQLRLNQSHTGKGSYLSALSQTSSAYTASKLHWSCSPTYYTGNSSTNPCPWDNPRSLSALLLSRFLLANKPFQMFHRYTRDKPPILENSFFAQFLLTECFLSSPCYRVCQR